MQTACLLPQTKRFFLQILATSEWPPPPKMHLLCTNTTELGKNFYFLGWQKQSKLFLHKAENIKIHLAIIKPLLNYSKMRSIFFPNGNFGPYYLLHWWKTSIKTSAFNEVHYWTSFFGKFRFGFWAVCCNIFQQWKKLRKKKKEPAPHWI